MNTAGSWSRKETDFNARDAALGAARRAGMSLRDWLDETWRLHASEIGAAVDDLDDEERAEAVARRLSRRRASAPESSYGAAHGSRRSDRYGAEAVANDGNLAREPDERIWARVSGALDIPDLNIPDLNIAAMRRSARHAESRRLPATRAPSPRGRFSIDEAIDDIAERQSELERASRRHRAREDERGAPLLKHELAKLADSLAELQRGASENVSQGDIEALRCDVAQIERGLAALAPRASVEHIETAINDLGRRLAEARTVGLVDEFVAPVEELIGDLKRTILGAAPTAALEAIERRVGTLSRNVDALAEARIDPDSVAALLEHSQDIQEMLRAAAANRPNVEALERRIADLAGRIDRIADRGQTSAGFEAIVQAVAQIRDGLELQNPIKAVKALDGRIDALARKIDQAATRSDVDAHFQRLGKRLDAMHRDLAERAPESRRLEDMFLTLQQRIEQARPAFSPAEARDLASLLANQISGKIDQAIRSGAEPEALGALEEQIARIAARLDARIEPQPNMQSAELARIEGILSAISLRLDNPLPISAADQVQETVRLLIERFESTLRQGVNGETLAAIERRLADVAARLDAPVTAELDTARLEAMIQDLAARMDDPGVAPSDVAEIKEALTRIADRMDAALRGEGDRTLSGIEEQIAGLAQRVETTSGAAADRLERALEDIQSEMERLRSELDGPAREVIEREIADLRSLHNASDRRTHATLNAVHETLEKVVDRLAMLEDEIESASTSKAPAAPAKEVQRVDDHDGYKPSIELNFNSAHAEGAFAEAPLTVAAASVSPAPRLPLATTPSEPVHAASQIIAERRNEKPAGGHDAAKAGPAPQRAAPKIAAPKIAAPKIAAPVFEDFLLEPGSGKPSPHDVAAAIHSHQAKAPAVTNAATEAVEPAADTPDIAQADTETDANAQANFIAAIRRAQQAAGMPEAGGASAGGQLLEEARARARAAAAEAEAQQTKASSGGAFGLKSLFSGRKRSTTAAGLTGLVVVLGALQAANMFYQSEKSRTMRSVESMTPATAKQLEQAAALVEGAHLGAMPPPADRFTPQAANVDMSPVASVPVEQPANEPALPRDPFALAATGDAHAQYELGVRFAEGRHGPRDAGKAIDWLTKSAEQNFAPAQYRLGVIYEKGLGVSRQGDRARALYLAAAERGHVRAMHNLGALLADSGLDGKPDYAAAARWFKKAAEHGVRDSQYNLAVLSARGLGVQQNLVESYVWFSAAAAQGDEDAGAKLKEVSSRLDAAQLARAQATMKAQRPKLIDPAVNEPLEPEGGWAVSPEPATKPTASRIPKISYFQAR